MTRLAPPHLFVVPMSTAPPTTRHVLAVLPILLLVMLSASPVRGDAPQENHNATLELSGDMPCVTAPSCQLGCGSDDRLWMISTRGLSSQTCRAELDHPHFSVSRLSTCGRSEPSSLEEYFATLTPDRPVVVYAHGNRLTGGEAIQRSMTVYRSISATRCAEPIDWVLFSWPATVSGHPLRDARVKAERTDAQGLYLAWLLRRHHEASLHTAVIGYSFGGRIATGSLHAMAGGQLGRRALPGPPVIGANIDLGLMAPAIDSNWMSARGYHGQSTKNLDHLVLLYNRRDAVLKRYWLLDKMRGRMALGFTGPRTFAPRADGSQVPVKSRDCARFIGLAHGELDYYQSRCRAGSVMASLINDIHVTN
jgi:hypothetical protein